MRPTSSLGRKGEEAVATWLKQHGYTILECNYRTRCGEVDIIASNHEIMAFVEVKTRTTEYFPTHLVVNKRKQNKVIKAALHYMVKHRISDKVIRFDIASVTPVEGGFAVDYIPNAFTKS
ncbi:MAG: YraN family protein [Candidatus Babeliales bacterium]